MGNSNKVFVSPGVYTSEKDLTYVAQSVGVTTLGLSGETLKGPAFEPVLITDFDEFKTYFGPTSPEKDGDGNPKYELAYVAKSYLQESNQLFVTRVLGLTGYKTAITFGISTLGGVVVDLTTSTKTTGTTTTFDSFLSGKTATDGTNIPAYISGQTYLNNDWFTIGEVPTGDTDGLTGREITGPIGVYSNANWFNNFYDSGTTKTYSYLFVYSTGTSGFTTSQYAYASTINEYDGINVAELRSRGKYVAEVLTLEFTGSTDLVMTSSVVNTNPLGEFTIDVTGLTSLAKTYTCSLDSSSPKFITKVLGKEVYDKSMVDFPVYVHEVYPNLVKTLYQMGLIRGLSTTLNNQVVDDDFMAPWDDQLALTPMGVSEVRGGKVSDLFQVGTISDGDTANYQVKVSIINIDLDSGEFDLIVRDFNDTDDNIVSLEKYSRCSMNPELPGYVALKVGTVDGEYELKSKYIILSMADNHPTDAIPAGFRGFTTTDIESSVLGGLKYKTSYLIAGDNTGYYDTATGEPITAGSTDKPKKISLGLSSAVGYDNSLLAYKGSNFTNVTHVFKQTQGFHLSSEASTIVNTGTITGFEFDTTPYDLEGLNKGLLDTVSYRKFTLAVSGGFDGWDIYRNIKTNKDAYIYGKKTYTTGVNFGVFSDTNPNSDYYAFLRGVLTFSNPEAVDINIFATPCLNYRDHNSLVSNTIDMIENDRADSLYIINSPNDATALEAVDDLDTASIDSNYSATFWPWIQIRDTDNSTQLYIPPTGEVCRNVALTDNVSYPWFAVAGYNRGLVNSIKALKKLTLDERDTLYKGRINPIATFADTGTIIWGNKTLQVRESALDRINVRRLLLRARKLISAVAVRLLFEQNDDQVRNEFLRMVNPILESIKKERGLYDFRVTVSNAPEDIDANTLRGKVYIKPTRSLEYIDVEFIITPTGASFENI